MQAVNYFLVVGVVFAVVWKLGAKRFAARRIPTRFDFSGSQVRAEIANTLLSLAIGTCSALVIRQLFNAGLTRLTPGDDWMWWQNVLAFMGLIVFNDAWFYWCHRLLHHPKLFKHVHAVHHRSVDVNPFTSYSFHGVEGFVLGAWSIPMALLVPMSLKVLMVAQAFGLMVNIVSHLGYEFLPRWWLKVPVLNMSSSATYHSLHHSKFNGNYGLMFRFWDRLMGTEVDNYVQVFTSLGESTRKPSSQMEHGASARKPA
jgi:sterol desaturase/sphingolipid hydroxylase (fatty acid hydroxylase superfamily)